MRDYYQNYLLEILDQLIFWTELSKEHPIVVNAFADLTNKKLHEALSKEISSYTKKFELIQKQGKKIKETINKDHIDNNKSYYYEIIELINAFSDINKYFIMSLKKLFNYGKNDKIWETILEHITEEQIYAMNLIDKYA